MPTTPTTLDHITAVARLHAEVDRLTTERDKLRAALEEVLLFGRSSANYECSDDDARECVLRMNAVAREALGR
jgi:hypothetical protein